MTRGRVTRVACAFNVLVLPFLRLAVDDIRHQMRVILGDASVPCYHIVLQGLQWAWTDLKHSECQISRMGKAFLRCRNRSCYGWQTGDDAILVWLSWRIAGLFQKNGEA